MEKDPTLRGFDLPKEHTNFLWSPLGKKLKELLTSPVNNEMFNEIISFQKKKSLKERLQYGFIYDLTLFNLAQNAPLRHRKILFLLSF